MTLEIALYGIVINPAFGSTDQAGKGGTLCWNQYKFKCYACARERKTSYQMAISLQSKPQPLG